MRRVEEAGRISAYAPLIARLSARRRLPDNDDAETTEFLVTARAQRWDRRTALMVAVLLVLASLLTAPIAASPAPVILPFVPAYDAALIIFDALTALLLLGQFRELRRLSVLVLGCGYLFTVPIVAAHALSYPGLFAPAGLFGGPETTAWLYVLWHGMFPIFVAGYAALGGREGRGEELLPEGSLTAATTAASMLFAILVAGCLLLSTVGHRYLPPLIPQHDKIQGATSPILFLPWFATLASLIFLVWRTRLARVLDWWLAIALLAWLCEMLVGTLLTRGRFEVGFYVGRLCGLWGASFVLAVLLTEVSAMYGRLARSLSEVRAQSAELARAQASLHQAQRLEAIGRLTGGVAHDFNNLLTVVIGSLDLMMQLAERPERVRALAETASRAADRGQQLIQHLLTFARQQITQPEIANPNRLIGALEGLLRRAAGESVEIVLDLDPAAEPVNIDPAQFEAALLNLVINARDAMAGAGRLTVDTGNVTLAADAVPGSPELQPGRYVRIGVSDTGTGMTPEVMTQAFEPFFTTKGPGRGSGVGLSQVYGFVKGAGGHVDLHSEVGIGTTVVLYLPRAIEPSRPVPQPPQPASPAATARQETILYVDDDEEVRGIAVQNLRTLGYRVLTAADGVSALGILRAGEQIDLLFSDVVMPGGLNGVQLAAEARCISPRLKVLLTSGYTAAALSAEHGLPTDLALLAKPYHQDELAKKLRLVMNG